MTEQSFAMGACQSLDSNEHSVGLPDLIHLWQGKFRLHESWVFRQSKKLRSRSEYTFFFQHSPQLNSRRLLRLCFSCISSARACNAEILRFVAGVERGGFLPCPKMSRSVAAKHADVERLRDSERPLRKSCSLQVSVNDKVTNSSFLRKENTSSADV